ncbi:MAG TPA: ornithine carbamoyltransferase [Alphaproteobacteria bacterium]|nr:ornithine carbamoyltransferase [Alphaproteobacteria bacterium]
MAAPRHFLDIDRIPAKTLKALLVRAAEMKRAHAEGANGAKPLKGKTLAMIFEKPSTRTRVSFEVGMRQLGGDVVTLNSSDMQLGRGETIEDTARVMSRYVDAIMLRTTDSTKLERLADTATVPVINGLSDRSHPCQVLADILTLQEKRGSVSGAVVAWIGDCNNVARSWIHAAERFGFVLRIACPDGLRGSNSVPAEAPGVTMTSDPIEAVKDADCVVTDVWVSMNDRDADERRRLLEPYRVDAELLSRAKPDVIFLHCLPARRGEEVTDEVIDGPHSAVWDEAENRLHAQKAILEWCLAPG